MSEVHILRIFNLLVGVVGLAIGLGVLLVPKTISSIEKTLDKEFSTEKLEKMLNERRNLSESLMKRPKVFAFFLLVVSFLLLLSSLLLF